MSIQLKNKCSQLIFLMTSHDGRPKLQRVCDMFSAGRSRKQARENEQIEQKLIIKRKKER